MGNQLYELVHSDSYSQWILLIKKKKKKNSDAVGKGALALSSDKFRSYLEGTLKLAAFYLLMP